MLSWRFTCFLLFLEVPGNHLEELHVAVDLLEEVVLIVLVVVYLVVRHLKYISKEILHILNRHLPACILLHALDVDVKLKFDAVLLLHPDLAEYALIAGDGGRAL